MPRGFVTGKPLELVMSEPSSAAHGGSVNPVVTFRYSPLALGRLLPRPAAPGSDWERFCREVNPSLGMLLIAAHARLRQVHPHGWTIAAAASHLPQLGQKRDELEAALQRLHGGSPRAIHLVELGQ